MKIGFNNYCYSFKKQLVAKADVIKEQNNVPCKIYRLSKKEDARYFEDLKHSHDWAGYKLLIGVAYDLKNPPAASQIYSLEDENEKCLGYVETRENNDDKEIIYIETCPSEKHQNKERKYKFIGETLMSFIAGLAKKDYAENIVVPSALAEAWGFYTDCCGFYEDKYNTYGLYLPRGKYDDLINQNKGNTKNFIKYV